MVVNNSITQLHNTTPEQLTERILKGVKTQLKELKKELEPNNRETYLTRFECAKFLSISLTTLDSWTKLGLCTAYKMGNRKYYKLSEIENQMDNSNKLLR